ncbi:MAG: basic secretory protein-like protein [bacterium]|nr:basic secretory protein-like protein [bacterium]
MKRIKVFLVLLMLALLTGSAWCGTLRCSQCGKAINGKYYERQGQVYCLEDYEKIRPRCSVCHKPIKSQYYTKDHKTYCTSCYTKTLPRCSTCKKPLKGKYYQLNKHNYCLTCYDKVRPVCVCCHKKIKGAYQVFPDGIAACQKCVKDKSKPRCAECRCPIDSFMTQPIPHYGGYVCEKHRFVAVTDPNVAAKLLQGARKNVVSTLGAVLTVRKPILDVKLVNLQELQKQAKTKSPGIRGFCLTRYNIFRMNHTIYVLAGMSRENMSRVLAHELAHAWQNENNPKVSQASERFVEGFAEWVSYKTTEVYGDKKYLEQMLDNQIEDYSQGLQDFLKYEKRFGQNAVLEAAKTKTSL